MTAGLSGPRFREQMREAEAMAFRRQIAVIVFAGAAGFFLGWLLV